MMHWETPWALGLLALVPLLAWRLFRKRRARDGGAILLPDAELAAALPRGWRSRLLGVLPVLRLVAVSLLIVALARPQLGTGRVKTSTEAVAIQIVVDRSGSMNEPMMFGGSQSTKIDVVKRVLAEFVLGDKRELKGRPNDMIGLVTFAGIPETLCPLVQDGKAVVELAQTIRLALRGPDAGTAIGDGLALAAARLKQEEETQSTDGGKTADGQPATKIKSKVIVLLTDGSNNRGEREPLEAAAMAAEWGIKVYTIGIGGGEAVPTRGFFGDVVRMQSDFDEPTLQRIAQMTGGIYRRAQDAEALRKVYAEIDALEKTTVQTTQFTDYDEQFMPLAMTGGGLLLLELVLATTFLRRLP